MDDRSELEKRLDALCVAVRDSATVDRQAAFERFDYFRHVVRRREGSEPAEVLLGLQDRFDTHFLDSPAWQRARAAA